MPDSKADGPTELLASMELQAGMEVGGYVIDGKIGEGGMGVVYGARHPRIGKRAAIKVLAPAFCGDPSTVSRFEQEARLVNEIRHPNIVDVFQFGELPDRRSFFVMEWLDGEPLSERIDRGPLSAIETIEIIDVVCDALEAAHEHGVIHRDLKSDNVYLVTSRGKRTVKLLDFGLAKLAGKGDPASIAKTRSGILVGTPSYMSPEQARGKSIDTRTDIYSLGVLTYKMLTGRLPFTADNPMDMILAHLKTPPPDPSKRAPATPPVLARMVVRMMAKRAEDRPTLAELRALFSELRAAPAPRVRRRAVSVLVGASLFLAGVIALGAVWLVQKSNTEPEVTAEPTLPTLPAVGSAEPIAALPPSGSAAPVAPPIEGSAGPSAVQGEGSAMPTPALEPATAGSAGPTVVTAGSAAAQPVIVTHAVAAAGSNAPPKPPRRAASSTPSVDPAAVIPPNRPGAIMVLLERSSTIEIDGTIVAQGSKGGRYDVRPGHHELRVKAAGRLPVSRSVEVAPGGTAVLRIDDAQAGGPADDPDNGSPE